MNIIVRGTKYEWDQARVTFAEARAIQKVTGKTLGEVGAAAEAGDAEAMQAILWTAMKRQETTLRYGDLDDLELGEFEVVPDPDEEQPEAAAPDPTVLAVGVEETSTPSA